jgi:hypothetical protein
MIRIARARKIPYRIGTTWLEWVLLPSVILLLSLVQLLHHQTIPLRQNVALPVRIFLAVLLLLALWVFASSLSRSITFSEDAIECRNFWLYRKYSYSELQAIRCTNKKNMTFLLEFADSRTFETLLNYDDIDFLQEILRGRAPEVKVS